MDIVNACAERESLGGNSYRSVLHVKPIAYLSGGSYLRSNHDFEQGDATWPHVVTRAPMMMSVGADGLRRIHPTRELDRYLEVGAPYVKPATNWTKVAFGTATRSANRIAWHRAEADLAVTFAGHFVKLDIELLGGYVPPNGQFAFPVGLTGLTRSGGRILRDGVEVMHLRAPDVYDAANTEDRRPIANEFVKVGNQWYALFTLPSLTGMSRPVVDPTFEVQPDAAAGKDTYIASASADTNYGTSQDLDMPATGQPCLVQFDLSSLAADVVVTATTLYLTMSWGSDATITGRRILPANVWVEAEATWNNRATSTAWAGSAGCRTSGTDYDATASFAVAQPTGNGEKTFAFSSDGIADVTAWIDGSADNNGLAVEMNKAGWNFVYRSSDYTTASARPKLTVVYSTGGNPHYYYQQL